MLPTLSRRVWYTTRDGRQGEDRPYEKHKWIVWFCDEQCTISSHLTAESTTTGLTSVLGALVSLVMYSSRIVGLTSYHSINLSLFSRVLHLLYLVQ